MKSARGVKRYDVHEYCTNCGGNLKDLFDRYGITSDYFANYNGKIGCEHRFCNDCLHIAYQNSDTNCPYCPYNYSSD